MKTGQTSPAFSQVALGQPVDRRAFLASAGLVGAAAGVGYASAASASGMGGASDGRLPDGSLLRSWEQPLAFSKSYYVDNQSPAADDNGPGSGERPFRTIGRAAELLRPGERVVIASGTYRECIRPVRGGTGPTAMISYEAAPGAKVFVKGSELLSAGWERTRASAAYSPPGAASSGGVEVWRHALESALFPDAYNPFALPSIMSSWGWLDGRTTDLGPYLRRRGLVFVDGKPLEPMEQLRELTIPELPRTPDFTATVVAQDGMPPRRRGGPLMQEIGGAPDARFWVDPSGTAITIRLPAGAPADHMIEVTTRQHVLVPVHSGTSFIRIKGIHFQHAGNAYPFPQFGMISLAGGDHWIFEDNVVEWANGLGLAIGADGYSAGAPRTGASHIVRGNAFRYCGVEGIGGMGTTDALVEDNLIEWCGWADAERGWEAAGAKFHRATNMMFRRNVVRHMRHANAAWWDVGNTNCRVTGNVFADILTVSGAVHFEVTTGHNAIDNNIIWDVRNAEPGTPGQRGCAGSGIFDNATDNLLIAHNLIGRCDNAGIFTITRPDRQRPTARGNQVFGNIFVQCGKAAIVFLDRDNRADSNVYAGMPDKFLGMLDAPISPSEAPVVWRHLTYRNLAEWRDSFGWDRASVMADLRVTFNTEALRLKVSGTVPTVKGPTFFGEDMFGKARRRGGEAGPLAGLGSDRAILVDPRRLSHALPE